MHKAADPAGSAHALKCGVWQSWVPDAPCFVDWCEDLGSVAECTELVSRAGAAEGCG